MPKIEPKKIAASPAPVPQPAPIAAPASLAPPPVPVPIIAWIGYVEITMGTRL